MHEWPVNSPALPNYLVVFYMWTTLIIWFCIVKTLVQLKDNS